MDVTDAGLWSRYFEATPYIVLLCQVHSMSKQEVSGVLLHAWWSWYCYCIERSATHRYRGMLFPEQPWWVYDPPFRTTLVLFGLALPPL